MIEKKYDSVPPAQATYDYFIDGTGIKLYYALGVSNKSAIPGGGDALAYKYILNATALESEDISTSGTTAADGIAFDTDFDLGIFTIPKDVLGTAYVVLNGTMTAGDPAINHSAAFKINFCKWDGSTETVIGTGYSNLGGTVTNGTNAFSLVVPITIAASFHFKPGDQLRLNVIAYTSSTNPLQGGTVLLYHEPTTVGQELKLYSPFII